MSFTINISTFPLFLTRLHPPTHHHTQQPTTSGLRERNVVPGPNWESKEAWSELVFTVDNSLFARLFASNSVYGFASVGGAGIGYRQHNNQLRVRCETNIYTLYRGAAEVDVEILDDHWPLNGLSGYVAKVSPTTELRGTGNNPDNSALTGSSLAWGKCSWKHWLLRMLLLISVMVSFS